MNMQILKFVTERVNKALNVEPEEKLKHEKMFNILRKQRLKNKFKLVITAILDCVKGCGALRAK